jgi:hypothetical protein
MTFSGDASMLLMWISVDVPWLNASLMTIYKKNIYHVPLCITHISSILTIKFFTNFRYIYKAFHPFQYQILYKLQIHLQNIYLRSCSLDDFLSL